MGLHPLMLELSPMMPYFCAKLKHWKEQWDIFRLVRIDLA